MGLMVTVVGAHPGVGTSLVAAGLARVLEDVGFRPVTLLDLTAGPTGAEEGAGPAGAVVVDAPPTYDDHVLDALRRSDRVLVVATPEGASLRTLALVVESYALLGLGADRVAVVLNRVAGPATEMAAKGVEALVGARVLAALPDDPGRRAWRRLARALVRSR
jgi:MinD-like ATPase involved in chromosome partitioning or flagellar assembly